MLKFLGKAVAGLVLTPEAQQAISYKIAELAKPTVPGATSPAATQRPPTATIRGPAGSASAPAATRAELLRRAMEVYAAKQSVLAGLDPESRAKLALLARTLLGGQGARPPAARGAAPRPATTQAAARPISRERAELLRQAMEIRAKGKETMLSGLGDEQRAELLCMAILSFAGGRA